MYAAPCLSVELIYVEAWFSQIQSQISYKEHYTCYAVNLTHHDPIKLLVLACGASPYSLGGVLSHQLEGGEYPIVVAS